MSCEKNGCKKVFHPECARRAKLSLEAKEMNHSQIVGGVMVASPKLCYTIYCDKHTPLKLRRVLESKEKKEREEILKFCKALDRCHQAYISEQKAAMLYQNEYSASYEEVPEILKSNSAVKKKKSRPEQETEEFLEQLTYWMSRIPADQHLINLEQVNQTSIDPVPNDQKTEPVYKVIDTSFIPNDPARKLTADDPIWHYIQYKDFSVLQKYNKYRKLAANKKMQLDRGLRNNKYVKPTRPTEKFEAKQTEKIRRLRSATQLQQSPLEKGSETGVSNLLDTVPLTTSGVADAKLLKKPKVDCMEQEENEEAASIKLYCICRSSEEDDDMIGKYLFDLMMLKLHPACDNCSEWFHFGCVGITESVSSATDRTWYCPYCKPECDPEGKQDRIWKGEKTDSQEQIFIPNQSKSEPIENEPLVGQLHKRINPYAALEESEETVSKKIKIDLAAINQLDNNSLTEKKDSEEQNSEEIFQDE